MKTEAEIRDWRMDLVEERLLNWAHPQMVSSISAAYDAISWALDDTPEKDLTRILALVAATHGEQFAQEWVQVRNPKCGGLMPLQYIAINQADWLLKIIADIPQIGADQ